MESHDYFLTVVVREVSGVSEIPLCIEKYEMLQ